MLSKFPCFDCSSSAVRFDACSASISLISFFSSARDMDDVSCLRCSLEISFSISSFFVNFIPDRADLV